MSFTPARRRIPKKTSDRKEHEMRGITPFLWFDDQAEEAAELYTSLFPNSKINGVTRYGDAGPGEPGSVMTVDFELDGERFVALNGGPQFSFSEAVSFVVSCESQEEVDEYWQRLSAGGEKGPCGWLKDRFGLSWQVVPTVLEELIGDPDPERSQRVLKAMMQMGKLEIEQLQRAYEGSGVPA
jgi:predicted 3-demethylubiquinone-9 3-methyltransferase (glyoxalase superfamily)